MGSGNDKGARREREKKKSSSKCEEADGHQRAPLKESQPTAYSQEPYGVAAANSKSRAGINGSTAMLPPIKRKGKRKEKKVKGEQKRQRIWLGFLLLFLVVPDLEMLRT